MIKVGKFTKQEKGGCPHPGQWPGLLAGAFPELFRLFCQPRPAPAIYNWAPAIRTFPFILTVPAGPGQPRPVAGARAPSCYSKRQQTAKGMNTRDHVKTCRAILCRPERVCSTILKNHQKTLIKFSKVSSRVERANTFFLW